MEIHDTKQAGPYVTWQTWAREDGAPVLYRGAICPEPGLREVWSCKHGHANRDAAMRCAEARLRQLRSEGKLMGDAWRAYSDGHITYAQWRRIGTLLREGGQQDAV